MTPYQAHKAKWIGCTRCPLHKDRRNVVLVRGQLPCDVLFVGEAPGINEDALGKPFVGPAGHKLDQIIGEAGGNLGRIRLAFTNIIACIPYDEDGVKVSEPSLWPKEAISRCASRVIEIIHIANPNRIVAVGKAAAKNLPGYKFTEIIHPAAILRANPAQQGLLYQKAVVTLAELFESFIPF